MKYIGDRAGIYAPRKYIGFMKLSLSSVGVYKQLIRITIKSISENAEDGNSARPY